MADPTTTPSLPSSPSQPPADRRASTTSYSRLPKAIRRLDPMGWVPATAKVAGSAFGRPQEVAASTARLVGTLARIPGASVRRLGSDPGAPPVPPSPRDKRFAEPTWDLNPAFFALRQLYLAGCAYVDELADAGARQQDPVTAAKARQFIKLAQNVASPTNFALTNPDVLGRALQTGGKSLVQGARFAGDDVRKRGGRPMKVDRDDFEVGRTLAATPGKVVYRNDLVELIQYAPQTDQVHRTPILFSPPWINKYYVMDLAPGRSFAEWAVTHNRTVFVLSYRNPDESMRAVTFDDYLEQGSLRAVEVVQQITGAEKVDVVGLCLGGISATISCAYLARTRPELIGSLTLLNTMIDCADAGELGQMITQQSMRALAERMAEKGYLAGQDMAFTFDLLRANDLIFNYVVSRWLKGEAPPAFDMLAWNEDSTHLTEAMYTQYMSTMYTENQLASGRFELLGERLDVGDIRSDVYIVGAINDHIVPWQASYASVPLFGGRVRYALSSGGHIAGIVNPPGPKAWCEIAETDDALPATAQDWQAIATRQPMTWWEDWIRWSNERAGALVAPPALGSADHPPLEDAPGSYVFT
ncbi:PHA/PHB synthase family protein [Cumulibacter manganitolerans]|uniref:PHA/PHB synthase family protein n=1 Tax=Cumulibacter manganitolerans TaxID=1884992 RepID=UPI001296A153|nr:alpha/beta fold hydrolase [Cumulibacter manganitolerans]